VPNALIVRKDFPAKNVPEFLAYARANAGKVSYASQGIGTTPFLIAKRLESMTGVSMNHVPYRGSALAMNDIAAGHIDSFFDAVSNALSLTQSGSSRILAVTDVNRSPLLPDVPTMAETIPGFRSLTWFAIAAPPGTPVELAQKISADVAAVIASPAINKRFVELGLTPVGGTPTELAKFIAEEDAVWSKLITSLKMEPQ
jgi:tripartite-type tricarboxylate transporter receptor subunit TctC